ncbi:PREDICTED: major facilitator superfamily domain-containing protein 6-A [Papilio polytes]|uniref:major facilitator superfamily domain-containing protein 6-A n=1 Tax=Papilio polytes TaxID=76194 RepID=UPI0006767FC4|nr:PREDICTED: major facilitator superfamily domain-containing protein 6-A [Papilio polytes]
MRGRSVQCACATASSAVLASAAAVRAMEPPHEPAPLAPPAPAARPLVRPDETGEVDTSRYPAPKDATNKVRGRSDLLELMCGPGAVDPELLTVKTFYFFFYSAFGSLFPLMGVYFKQMGMNAGQCGLLIGTRPFVEFLSAPFWGGLADRWQKGRTLLLASLGAWIIFTLPLSWVQPSAVACVHPVNKTDYRLDTPSYDDEWTKNEFRSFHRSAAAAHVGSPLPVDDAIDYDPNTNGNWVTPLHSFIVYSTPDIQKTFFLLLLLVVIGEFFSAPAITLADSAVITLLGEDADRYGHQRMFGSLGWGLAMFFVGIALDHSTAFSKHPCGGPQRYEKNYTICFATFSVLMGAALITATQVKFKYEELPPEPMVTAAPQSPTREEKLQQQLAEQLQLPGLDTSAPARPQPPLEQAKVFAQTTREMPEWVTVLRQFQNVKAASFLLVAWFMGFGIGLIFTFLFWHLQDKGGSPTLFGVASVINHISEIFAYFFSFKLITQMGHVKVLCLGLAGNVLRFLYIAWLPDPWWVLPFEFVQGVTHAAVWAACCSYIAHGAPPRLRSSAQGVLQGLHHGLGRGCGAVLGGIAVTRWGTTRTFAGYGLLCGVALAAFAFVNFRDGGEAAGGAGGGGAAEEEARALAEAGVLAPHGVPSNPLPRALSSTRLADLANHDSYGATQSYAGADSLSVPGAPPPRPSNPFLAEQAAPAPGPAYR